MLESIYANNLLRKLETKIATLRCLEFQRPLSDGLSSILFTIAHATAKNLIFNHEKADKERKNKQVQ